MNFIPHSFPSPVMAAATFDDIDAWSTSGARSLEDSSLPDSPSKLFK